MMRTISSINKSLRKPFAVLLLALTTLFQKVPPLPSVGQNFSKEASIDRRNLKPYFFLHVGLPKTGTTFLQCSLCGDDIVQELLRLDNYTYLGTCPPECRKDWKKNKAFLGHTYASFFKSRFISKPRDSIIVSPEAALESRSDSLPQSIAYPPALTPNFVKKVKEAHLEGLSVILVFEGFYRYPIAYIEAMSEFLKSMFDVKVVMNYRRWYEWLPSWYYQLMKLDPTKRVWPGHPLEMANEMNFDGTNGTVGLPNLPFDLDNRGRFSVRVQDIEEAEQHPTQTTAMKYSRYYDDVLVVPQHAIPVPKENSAANPYLYHLFCDVVKETRQACRGVTDGRIRGAGEKNANPKIPIIFDVLAVEMHEDGFLPGFLRRRLAATRIQLLVHEVGEETRHRCNAVNQNSDSACDAADLFSTLVTMPTKCLSNPTINRIKTMSWRMEQNLFFTHQFKSSIQITETAEPWTLEHHDDSFERSRQKLFCWVDPVIVRQRLPEGWLQKAIVKQAKQTVNS